MRELIDIVAAHAALVADGKPSALATVVAVEGSAYRRPGARMLIAEDGRTWGGVSGGCLERDVASRGRGVIASGRPFLMRYDTSADEAADRGVTTGCGGTIEVLIQSMPAGGEAALAVLARVLAEDHPRVLATVIRATRGWSALEGLTTDVTELLNGRPPSPDKINSAAGDGLPFADQGPESLWTALAAVDRQEPLRSTSQHRVTAGGHTADIFLALVRPPQRLVLIGGGPDVLPVVAIAKTLGWRVAVVAARPALHLHERFAAADERYVTDADAPLAGVPLTPRDAVIVMTHNLARDTAALAALACRPCFLGVLGPRHRSDRLLIALPPQHPARTLRSPVGLDLGSETPEEIALSIVAEVQTHLRTRTARPLSESATFAVETVGPPSGAPCPA